MVSGRAQVDSVEDGRHARGTSQALRVLVIAKRLGHERAGPAGDAYRVWPGPHPISSAGTCHGVAADHTVLLEVAESVGEQVGGDGGKAPQIAVAARTVSSRCTMSKVHRSPTTSRPRVTAQYSPYDSTHRD